MTVKIGVQLHPQATTTDEMRAAWRAADELGVDSIYTWDHFYPLYGDPDASHFECYTLLAAMAVETKNARIGALVTCNSYRNPQLLADMSRTIDHLSGGRFLLGIGSGWFERDYTEYGYEFGDAVGRLKKLEADLPLIKGRLEKLNPGPVNGHLPIMIGGGGEKRTLRLVAEHADVWNGFGKPEDVKHKHDVIDEWCGKVGREPSAIERTVATGPEGADLLAEYEAVGTSEIIFMIGNPYDLAPVEKALAAR